MKTKFSCCSLKFLVNKEKNAQKIRENVMVDKYKSAYVIYEWSPSNGKARLQSSFIYITASEGPESHLFVKSKDRRIHHSEKVCN